MKLKRTSMSVKLTKSPAEQQSHNHGLQLNANKPLKHNCRVKDRETLGHYKVVNIKVLMLHVTSFQFLQIFQFSKKKKNQNQTRCTTPIYVLFICKKEIKSVEELRRYRPYKLMNILSPFKKFYIFHRIFISSIFKKIKINPALHSSIICSFHIQKEN